jgi:hypothetical protein
MFVRGRVRFMKVLERWLAVAYFLSRQDLTPSDFAHSTHPGFADASSTEGR